MAQVSPSPNIMPAIGRVGIGTLLPSEKLQVVGNVKIDSNLFLNGQLRVKDIVSLDSSLTVSGPTQLKNLSISLTTQQAGANTTNFGSLKIQNLPFGQDSTYNGSFFLKVDEYGNIYKAYSLSGGPGPGGSYTCAPNSVERFNPVWINSVDKIYTQCPEIRVGLGTSNPLVQLHSTGYSHSDGMTIGNRIVPNSNATADKIKLEVKSDIDENYFDSKNLMIRFSNSSSSVFELAHNGSAVFKSYVKSASGSTIEKVFEVRNNTRTLFQIDHSGLAHAREIKVDLANSWPDYVFQNSYRLAPLSEVEAFITEHKHLPGFPSAKEVEANEGIKLGETNRLLTEKVEELTLYLIQMEKRMKELETKIGE